MYKKEGEVKYMNMLDSLHPTTISDFIPDSEAELEKLKLIVENAIAFPSAGKRAIIFHGQYGAGKTALARLLPSEMERHRVNDFSKGQFSNFGYLFMSCSATGGSNIAQKSMPTSVSFNQSGLHYVVLDEVDNLRSDAQKNMKSFITEYDHVIYIMTTNHLSNIDPGLISRSHCISFENPCREMWKAKCEDIFEKFGCEANDIWIRDLVSRSKGDARAILSEIEIYIRNQTKGIKGVSE